MKKAARPAKKKTATKKPAPRPKPRPVVQAPAPRIAVRPAETKTAEGELSSRDQAKTFERAAAMFHKGEFAKARQSFRIAAGGPNRDMMHAALMHIRMCDRRLSSAAPELKTPEEHYTYAVALMNRGQLQEAEEQFRQSLRGHEHGDHIHYGLALCYGLRGNLERAFEHLKRAIDLRPQNRVVARNDPDFQTIASQPPLRGLLFPERTDTA